MINLCPTAAHVIGRSHMQNNMILTLIPVNAVSSNVSREAMRMDTKRDHMAGGRMVTIRPTVTPADENHNHRTEEADNSVNFVTRYGNVSNNQNAHRHRAKVHVPDKKASLSVQLPQGSWSPLLLNDGRPASAIVTQDTQNAGGNVLLCSQEALLPLRIHFTPVTVSQTLPGTQDNMCTCQKDRRHSSGSGDDISDAPRSPRSPLQLVPETPSRTDCLSPLPPPSPLVPRGEVQKYENIPVPGIIPLSRATSSPTPQPLTSSTKDTISFYSRLSCLSATSDKQLIIAVEHRLKESGFYYDDISAQEAKKMLHAAQVGTFLVRISSQTSHFFALSVKTNRGTTSIRIAYDSGCFRLDADPESIAKMPAFDCVVALIEYYVVQSASDARNKCVFLESNGRRDTPVILTRPLRNKSQALRHLCRRAIHYHLSPTQCEEFLHKSSASVQVREYLNSYPYAL